MVRNNGRLLYIILSANTLGLLAGKHVVIVVRLWRRLIRKAGPDGLTLEQVSSAASVSADKAEKLLEAALRFGLAQRVGGYQAWAFVAAEHCQRFRPGNATWHRGLLATMTMEIIESRCIHISGS